MPFPKSAAAATRCSGEGSSSARTGTANRIQSVAGPRSRKPPSAKRCSTPSAWNAGLADLPARLGRHGGERPGRSRHDIRGSRPIGRQVDLAGPDPQERRSGEAPVVGVVQRDLDDGDLAARPDDVRGRAQRCERDRSLQVERQAGHLHRRGRLAVHRLLADAADEGGHRSAVQRIGGPRPSRQLGGRDPTALTSDEQRVAHPGRVEARARRRSPTGVPPWASARACRGCGRPGRRPRRRHHAGCSRGRCPG